MSRHQIELHSSTGQAFVVYVGWDTIFGGFFYEVYDKAEHEAAPDEGPAYESGMRFPREVELIKEALRKAVGVAMPDALCAALASDRDLDDGRTIARWSADGERIARNGMGG